MKGEINVLKSKDRIREDIRRRFGKFRDDLRYSIIDTQKEIDGITIIHSLDFCVIYYYLHPNEAKLRKLRETVKISFETTKQTDTVLTLFPCSAIEFITFLCNRLLEIRNVYEEKEYFLRLSENKKVLTFLNTAEKEGLQSPLTREAFFKLGGHGAILELISRDKIGVEEFEARRLKYFDNFLRLCNVTTIEEIISREELRFDEKVYNQVLKKIEKLPSRDPMYKSKNNAIDAEVYALAYALNKHENTKNHFNVVTDGVALLTYRDWEKEYKSSDENKISRTITNLYAYVASKKKESDANQRIKWLKKGSSKLETIFRTYESQVVDEFIEDYFTPLHSKTLESTLPIDIKLTKEVISILRDEEELRNRAEGVAKRFQSYIDKYNIILRPFMIEDIDIHNIMEELRKKREELKKRGLISF